MRLPRKAKKVGRVVRHTLADGTVKEYRYAPHRGSVKAPSAGDSVAALITAYQRSPEWRGLRPATRQYYELYLQPLLRVGHIPVATVRRRDLLSVRDQIAIDRGNGAANGFVGAVSALFTWAVRREWIEHSPATQVEKLEKGHLPAWTQQEADIAIAKLPEHLRRAVILALYTGQRRGDLCAMTWSAYNGSTIRLVQQKTGEPLVLSCHPDLRRELDQWRSAADPTVLTILTSKQGRPLKPVLLSFNMAKAMQQIGLPDNLSMHGLRKLAAANLAEAGCSTHEIASVTGHRTLAMVALYTRSADQERLAEAAIIRLSEYQNTKKYKRTNT